MGILFENAMIVSGLSNDIIHDGFLLVENQSIVAMGEGSYKDYVIQMKTNSDDRTRRVETKITPVFASGTLSLDAENELKSETETHFKINAKGKMLLPAFFNAHTHVPMTLLRNYADDMDLHTWLFSKIFPIEEKLDGNDIYHATQLGLMEMIAGGCAGFSDMYYFCDQTIDAVLESGMRAYITRGLTCFEGSVNILQDERIQDSLRLHEKYHGTGDGRIRTGLGPHAIYTCSTSYLSAIAELAMEKAMSIHIHVDETLKEHQDSIEKYGKTPVEYLQSLGIFQSPVIAAHCVHVTQSDIDILASNHVVVAHNPRSNLKLASGIAPVASMLKAGIHVALGTDGASSNNNLDMWSEMMFSGLLHKGNTLDPLAVSAADAIRMASLEGAAAMGFLQSGSLSVGKNADIQMLDITQPHWQPLHNPLSAVVYSGKSSDVKLTMVNGKILYQDGSFLTIDQESVMYNLEKSVKKVFEK